MQLSHKQEAALDRAGRWYEDPSAPQVLRLFGFAGTGKTTLAKFFAEITGARTLYCAFTGKAAHVLRSKGCTGATTIHALIYRPAGDPPSPAQIEALRERLKQARASGDPKATLLAEQLASAEQDGKRTGPRFSLNLDSDVSRADLVIVDEASMCDARIGADLESFGTKLLVLGDPAQLPPVYGAGYFTDREPDIMLEEIHRQALDSPILKLATLAREGTSLPYGAHGEGVEVLRYGDLSLEERAKGAEMIIVGRNKTRHACNAKIRRLLGRANEPAPVVGDRVICRRNNHELGLLNGATGTIERCLPDFDRMTAKIEVKMDDGGAMAECEAWLHPFMAREGELNGFTRREKNEFHYAWAITCHSSQGSQWDDVLVFDESRQFGREAHRHLYTALTRAARTLTVVQ